MIHFLLVFPSNLSEPTPQTPKAPSSSIEDDQSIDEILGLQVLNFQNCPSFSIYYYYYLFFITSIPYTVLFVIFPRYSYILTLIICPLIQGEIHMSEDAIHDILKQTESDPAFQALFDLFDYSKCYIVFALSVVEICVNMA